MSDDEGQERANVFEVDDAHVHEIKSVQNNMLRALCAHYYSDHYPATNITGKTMQLGDARQAWNQDPRLVRRRQHADDAEAAADELAAAAASNDGDDDNFGELHEDNNNNVPDIELLLNHAELGDDDDYSTSREDNYKRHSAATSIRATVVVKYDGGRKLARVTGNWPVLSSSIPLRICGTIERNTSTTGGITVVQATSRNARIELAPTFDSVSGRQFYNILRESGTYELPVVRKYVTLLFADPSAAGDVGQDEQEPGAAPRRSRFVFQSRWALHAHDAAARRDAAERGEDIDDEELRQAELVNEELYRASARNILPIAELRQRLAALGDATIERMMVRAPFVSLGALMVLRAPELVFIASVYDESTNCGTWRELLARGTPYIDAVYELLTTRPYTLCFQRLRKQCGREQSVPALGLLPDLPLDKFQSLVQTFNLTRVSPAIAVAVAMHKKIFHADVYGEPTDDNTPLGTVPASSGHMFSVLAAHPDDNAAQSYHDTDDGKPETDPTKLCDENPATRSGRFCLLPGGPDAYPHEMRVWLNVDRHRISRHCTHDHFIGALHWLVEQKLIVLERLVGTGPRNRGMPIDAIYLAEIYETQQRTVDLLSDIFERGVLHSQNGATSGDDQQQLSPTRLILLHRAQTTALAEYQELYAPAVRAIGKAPIPGSEQPAPKRRRISTGGGGDGEDDDEEGEPTASGDDGDAEDEAPHSPISHLARRIANDDTYWRAQYEQYLTENPGARNRATDAYADARSGREHRCLPLLRVAPFTRVTAGGHLLGDEQIAALERMAWMPIVQITGRGGVGKSELISIILRMYPPEQVLCLAPTGNVTSDLAQRTGVKAMTIHSALTREAHFMEAQYRARSYRARALRQQQSQQYNAGGAASARRAEQFTRDDVYACTDERELRAYVDEMLGYSPPFASPFAGKRVVIVDEVSLAGLALLRRMFEGAHAPAKLRRFVCRLVFVGDFDQLPPLGAGSPQSDIGHGIPLTACELVTNRRSVGTGLFNVAQAIAEHRYTLPMPMFDDESVAYRAIRDHADMVAVPCDSSDLRRTLEKVLLELRATSNLEQRCAIQFITTTNATARIANEQVRWKYFGEDMLADYQDDILAQQSRHAHMPPLDLVPLLEKEREKIMRRLHMQVRVDDRIYLKRNIRVVFPARGDGSPRREVQFSNSRRLRAVQFYDAPMRLTAKSCRCGLCPDKPEDAPPHFRHPCMERLDLVPGGRRRRIDPSHNNCIKYHDQGVTRNSTGRRMGVFVDDNQNYVEMDVMRMLVPRSRYDNGFALTTHRLQGSQADIVVYICVDDRWYINWKFLYTAITRARCRAIILSTNKVFNQLVRRKAPVRRSTMWLALLKNVGATLQKYPASPAAAFAADSYPQLYNLRYLTVDEQWAIFENARYRTDRERVVLE